jgi:hypothetical protein
VSWPGTDRVVEKAAEKTSSTDWPPVKQMEVLPGYYHDIYHETEADRPLRITWNSLCRAFGRRNRRRSATPTRAGTSSRNISCCGC